MLTINCAIPYFAKNNMHSSSDYTFPIGLKSDRVYLSYTSDSSTLIDLYY